ncbi:MAG: tetratricopeptide repeat protein, partial [bacterium]
MTVKTTRKILLIAGIIGSLLVSLPALGQIQIRTMEPKAGTPRPAAAEQALMERARRFEERGESERALEAWRATLEQNAWNAYAIDGIRRNLVYLKRYEEAIGFTEGVIARSRTRGSADMGPNDLLSPYTLTLGLGEIYLAQGVTERAWEIWNRALASESKSPSAVAQLVRILQRNRLWEDAETLICDYRKESRQPAFMALELAQSLQQRMAWGAATRELVTYLAEAPTSWEIAQAYLSRFPDDSAVHAEVRGSLERAIREQKRDLNLRRLFAGYLFRIRNFVASYEQTVAIDSLAERKGEEVLPFARKLLKEDEIALASRAFSWVLKQEPPLSVRLEAELGLADCLLLLEKYAEAKAAYEAFVQAYPQAVEAVEARFRIAIITLRHERRPAEALSQLRTIEKGSKTLSASKVQLHIGDCLVWMERIPEAIEIWRKIARTTRSEEDISGEAGLRIGRAHLWVDSLVLASGVFDSMMTMGDFASRSFNDAVQYGNLLLEGGSSEAMHTFAKGDLALFREEPAKAAAQFERVADLAKRGRLAEWGRYLQAVSLRKAAEPLTATQVLEKFIVDFPQSRDIDRTIFLLAEVQEEDLHDEAAARANYEKILTDFPQSTYLEQARKRA